jgi:predicted small secreted protein
MKRLFVVISLVFLVFILTGCGTPQGVGRSEDFNEPDIKSEFCGVHLNYQYCKCAFHGDFCEDIGMSSKEASKYVDEQYNNWLETEKQSFGSRCVAANGYIEDDTCNYCEQGYKATKDSCLPGEPEQVAELPDGPYNKDCSLKQEEFDRDWKKYSDIDDAIPAEDRSYEAKQALTVYETMIGKLMETFEIQRDIEIEEQMQSSLNEYRQALVQNQKANLLKAFWRLSWVTYSTIKSGITAGKSYGNLMTSAGNAVQSVGSGLKIFQAVIPANSDLAIDKSQLSGKAMSVGAKTALEGVESLGDPVKVAVRFVKSAADVTLPSANITEAEINILRQQQIDKGVVDQVLLSSQAANAERQARLTALEQEIKSLESQISEWETKEKERVSSSLVDSCKKLTGENNSASQNSVE